MHKNTMSFMLADDLFPALNVTRKRDLQLERDIKTAALDLKMQPDDGFLLKVMFENMIYVDFLSTRAMIFI